MSLVEFRRVDDEQACDEELRRVEDRLHIYEGLVRVLDEVEAFVEVVLAGENPTQTIELLQQALNLSEVQAVAALDMQFRRLGKASQAVIRADLAMTREERDRLIRR